VVAPRPPTTPPRGASIDTFCIEWWALPDLQHRLPGGAIDIFFIDCGRSRISVTASQGGPPLTFFALIMGAPGSPSPPLRGPTIDVFCIEWWVLPDLHHRLPGEPPSMFFALMVDATESLSPPPRGPPLMFFALYDGCSRIFKIASQGTCH
jgi:hypothetical protein